MYKEPQTFVYVGGSRGVEGAHEGAVLKWQSGEDNTIMFIYIQKCFKVNSWTETKTHHPTTPYQHILRLNIIIYDRETEQPSG